ncbi:MAG: hypothetical protein RJA36_6 [Pseudomonadota bacterium]|jgi:hypothetical protein
MSLQQIQTPPQSLAEEVVNRNFQTLEAFATYGQRQEMHSGLTWGYYGGRWGGFSVADGTLTLSNATNYVVVQRSDGAISTSTTNTNWNNTSSYARVYQITASGGVVTAVQDHRAGPAGVHYGDAGSLTQGDGLDVDAAGFRGIPQNSQSGNYTCVAADAGKHILHPSGGGSGDTITIPSNASVAYEIGTTLTMVNADSNSVSIAITSDTLTQAGTTNTGTRTLAQNGVATAIKVTSTGWIISGTGLT